MFFLPPLEKVSSWTTSSGGIIGASVRAGSVGAGAGGGGGRFILDQPAGIADLSSVVSELGLLSSGEGTPTVESISDQIEVLHVAGPNSYKVVGELNKDVVNIPFLASELLQIEGVECRIFRTCFGVDGFRGLQNGVTWTHISVGQQGSC